MKRALAAIALCSLPFFSAAADDLEEELRKIAALEAELQPLIQPILIPDASVRVFTNGQSVPFVVDTFMDQPAANRTLRFDMIDQKKPLMDSNGGALGCGWFVELNGHFWVTAFGKSLRTRWAGFGKIITDPVIDVATSIQPRGYVKPPPCPVYINCRWVQKCRWGICVPWYECEGRILDCSKCSIGGGFEVLPPRFELQATIDYSGVEITARPLTDVERAIVSTVGELPGMSTADLAIRIARPEPEVDAAAQLLKKATLIDDPNGWKLTDGVGDAHFRAGGIALIDVVQPNVYYIINFKKCLDLPFNEPQHDPCIEMKEEFPSGRLATAGVVVQQKAESPIEVQDTVDLVFDGPWKGRSVATNAMASRFEATEHGLGLNGLVNARWSDIAQLEKYLKVHVTDTGNGEAIFIETAAPDPVSEGKRMLIGAGSTQSIGRIVDYLEHTAGLRPNATIDYFVVTQPGPDAMANAVSVVERFNVKTLVHSGAPGGYALRRLLRSAAGHGVRVVDLRKEAIQFDLGRNIKADVLASYDPALPVSWLRRARNASIVLKLTHGRRTFLLTGGIGFPVEEKLLASGVDLRSDVLKVAHSGSSSASLARFLSAVSPRLAVISALGMRGWGNLPSPETVARLDAAGAKVVSTSEGDAHDQPIHKGGDDIVILSDGDAMLVFQFDPVTKQWRPVSF